MRCGMRENEGDKLYVELICADTSRKEMSRPSREMRPATRERTDRDEVSERERQWG